MANSVLCAAEPAKAAHKHPLAIPSLHPPHSKYRTSVTKMGQHRSEQDAKWLHHSGSNHFYLEQPATGTDWTKADIQQKTHANITSTWSRRSQHWHALDISMTSNLVLRWSRIRHFPHVSFLDNLNVVSWLFPSFPDGVHKRAWVQTEKRFLTQTWRVLPSAEVAWFCRTQQTWRHEAFRSAEYKFATIFYQM